MGINQPFKSLTQNLPSILKTLEQVKQAVILPESALYFQMCVCMCSGLTLHVEFIHSFDPVREIRSLHLTHTCISEV